MLARFYCLILSAAILYSCKSRNRSSSLTESESNPTCDVNKNTESCIAQSLQLQEMVELNKEIYSLEVAAGSLSSQNSRSNSNLNLGENADNTVRSTIKPFQEDPLLGVGRTIEELSEIFSRSDFEPTHVRPNGCVDPRDKSCYCYATYNFKTNLSHSGKNICSLSNSGNLYKNSGISPEELKSYEGCRTGVIFPIPDYSHPMLQMQQNRTDRKNIFNLGLYLRLMQELREKFACNSENLFGGDPDYDPIIRKCREKGNKLGLETGRNPSSALIFRGVASDNICHIYKLAENNTCDSRDKKYIQCTSVPQEFAAEKPSGAYFGNLGEQGLFDRVNYTPPSGKSNEMEYYCARYSPLASTGVQPAPKITSRLAAYVRFSAISTYNSDKPSGSYTAMEMLARKISAAKLISDCNGRREGFSEKCPTTVDDASQSFEQDFPFECGFYSPKYLQDQYLMTTGTGEILNDLVQDLGLDLKESSPNGVLSNLPTAPVISKQIFDKYRFNARLAELKSLLDPIYFAALEKKVATVNSLSNQSIEQKTIGQLDPSQRKKQSSQISAITAQADDVKTSAPGQILQTKCSKTVIDAITLSIKEKDIARHIVTDTNKTDSPFCSIHLEIKP